MKSCSCSDGALTVCLPPAVLPLARYAVLTTFSVAAYVNGLVALRDGDYLEISGDGAFNKLKSGLNLLKVKTPEEFCNEFCNSISYEARGDSVEVRLGKGGGAWRRFGNRDPYELAKKIVKDFHMYTYARFAWGYLSRREVVSRGGLKPVGGHVNLVSFSDSVAHVIQRVSLADYFDEKYFVYLADLSRDPDVNRLVVEHFYSFKEGKISLNVNLPRVKGAPLGRLLDVWLKLYTVVSLPRGAVGDVPTFAVGRAIDRFVYVSHISGFDLKSSVDALRGVAEELGLSGEDAAARFLMGLIRRAKSVEEVHYALLFAEECLAGRVDWDLYYLVSRFHDRF